jgi:hypothetical protein
LIKCTAYVGDNLTVVFSDIVVYPTRYIQH